MYEDLGVTERHTTAVFTFASDDGHELSMRQALTAALFVVANQLGCDVEIHDEDMLERGGPFD